MGSQVVHLVQFGNDARHNIGGGGLNSFDIKVINEIPNTEGSTESRQPHYKEGR